MFRFVISKIKNKKWLSVCLLIGISLLVAVFTCHPMLENGAADNLLKEGFSSYVETNNLYPAVLSRNSVYQRTDYGTTIDRIKEMEQFEALWLKYVGVKKVESQKYVRVSMSSASSSRDNAMLTIGLGYMENLDDHIEIIKGKHYAECETYINSNGDVVFPCIISKSVMDNEGYVLGDEFTYVYTGNSKNEKAAVYIAGVFDKKDDADIFWHINLDDIEKTVFVSDSTIDDIVKNYGSSIVEVSNNLLLDYNAFSKNNSLEILDYLEQFKSSDKYFSSDLINLLKQYRRDFKTINTVLYVLELPCVLLIIIFLYMVSSQILSLEEGEIAVLRSRGVTKKQTVRLYFIQAIVMSAAGFVIGIGLGIIMCKFAAGTDAFLSFTLKDTSAYGFSVQCLIYAAIACVLAIIFMTIPVFKKAGITIVAQKSANKYSGSRAFFEKIYLDIILIGVSVYFLITYNRQAEKLAEDTIAGKRVDPMMFLNSSIFIFACGLLMIRLIRYLILLIDKIGKNKWKPATYATFLQTKRTYAKQSFIAVFIIMTMSNGIFNANMARTISENSLERIRYNTGADIICKSEWRVHTIRGVEGVKCYYEEPNFDAYEDLYNDRLCESLTKVITCENITLSGSDDISGGGMLYGIHTSEFGRTAYMTEELTKEHWFNSLNALALDPDGAIISSNIAKKFNLKTGDVLRCRIPSPSGVGDDKEIALIVCAITDAFPGYNEYEYIKNPDGTVTKKEKFLIVANYATIVSRCGIRPYGVWMKLADNVKADKIKNVLEEKNVEVKSFVSRAEEISHYQSLALIQVTNGMFTMSFIIPLLTASVGFLLYWIMSIQNRELLFGIYRAMGMPIKDINRMLILEQVFSSLLPLIAGIGIGSVCTFIFAGFMGIVYLPEKHAVPLKICFYPGDILKITGVLIVVFILCFLIIRRILKNMKIAQALKLGED